MLKFISLPNSTTSNYSIIRLNLFSLIPPSNLIIHLFFSFSNFTEEVLMNRPNIPSKNENPVLSITGEIRLSLLCIAHFCYYHEINSQSFSPPHFPKPFPIFSMRNVRSSEFILN